MVAKFTVIKDKKGESRFGEKQGGKGRKEAEGEKAKGRTGKGGQSFIIIGCFVWWCNGKRIH